MNVSPPVIIVAVTSVLSAIAGAVAIVWKSALDSRGGTSTKRLEGAHQQAEWQHSDWKGQQGELIDCVTDLAKCEARHEYQVKEIVDLVTRLTAVEVARDKLTEELGNAKQKLVSARWFDEEGKLDAPALIKLLHQMEERGEEYE